MAYRDRKILDTRLFRAVLILLVGFGGFQGIIILIASAQANTHGSAGNIPSQAVTVPWVDSLYPACQMTSTLVLASYQAWHGLPDHLQLPPYLSTDPEVIARYIRMAQEQCLGGFVVDWYGPPDGLANDADRDYIDSAAAELLEQSGASNLQIGLMYDEGTLSSLTALTTTRVISDLLYARSYFTRSNYLTISGKPALFVFPYPNIDPNIDWNLVRQKLDLDITLLDEDPDPGVPAHDALFDGFNYWVQATPWRPDSYSDWGEDYLNWFYPTLQNPAYKNKIGIGGVWPGFDDSRAGWGVTTVR
jgi:hypothetical protein